jgi:hypothetical protein
MHIVVKQCATVVAHYHFHFLVDFGLTLTLPILAAHFIESISFAV